ncbi:hypothetical protein SNOG_00526 [Parastagonospora nodorum SN15]|uniref:Uncharacterized protein n=1 Tax=Phaeosphaeria nodorum (strain SN15 / ATCC MYA-4574 / FGSC 10173) TaxID=321614 RepID=Q0V638_PHANO|nr:hypothetical protein SNOG_00526 [Parastagonospora nodorum SN15]EAT92021.1 hypothetical protein SNOG_00526 [Parastagonospora nodorum SN15]
MFAAKINVASLLQPHLDKHPGSAGPVSGVSSSPRDVRFDVQVGVSYNSNGYGQ